MSNEINKQTLVTPELADLFAIWDTGNSSTRRTSLNYLLELFQDNLEFSDNEPTTQYSSPLTATTVDVRDDDADTHLILTPSGTIATLTITLPASTSVRDKQILIVTSTNIVSTLTMALNGATAIRGNPTTIAAANDYFTLKYDATLTTWYRIG
jgi:hypothetical protein